MMNDQPILQYVQLTAPGRGAVATLLVEGPGAVRAVTAQFRLPSGRTIDRLPLGRVLFGRFGPEPAEEVVLCRRGEESVELSCHGGLAAVEMVGRLLAAEGCREMPWREMLRCGQPDPLAAEARLALADAPTERTAAILLDQYHGALRRAIEAARECLHAGRRDDARQGLRRLLAWTELGRHLVRPWRVVLAGRPNVGKSSLINALLGYGRAIVHHVPGTTRDVLTARTAMLGWPVELADTAGLRDAEEEIERAGIQRAEEQLASADLVLLVADLTQPWSDADAAMLAERPRAVLVHSKCDLSPAAGPTRPAGLMTSAATGQGVAELVEAVATRLVPETPPPSEAVPFTQRLVDRLTMAQQALAAADGPAVDAILAETLAGR